jgi:hypothetical protein
MFVGNLQRLAELSNTGHLHDRRFLLPICKASGLLMVRIHASKLLPVLVKDGHLPVLVFPAPVFPEFRALPDYHLEKYYHLS